MIKLLTASAECRHGLPRICPSFLYCGGHAKIAESISERNRGSSRNLETYTRNGSHQRFGGKRQRVFAVSLPRVLYGFYEN